MKLVFDEAKRLRTLMERDLDFAEAAKVFTSGDAVTVLDDRRDYGEVRRQTVGTLNGVVVMIVWTNRPGSVRRIISMRKCNERERKRYARAVD